MNRLNTEKLLSEINQKWITKSCPMCGQNNWNVDGNIVSPMRLSGSGDIQLGGEMMPLVAVTCMNCGNVVFVNPLVIGAVDTDSKDK